MIEASNKSLKAKEEVIVSQESLIKEQKEHIEVQTERVTELEDDASLHPVISIGAFILGIIIGIPLTI